jgi:hypothetical protein
LTFSNTSGSSCRTGGPSPACSQTATWQNFTSSHLASPSIWCSTTEVAAAALLADQGVAAHQLGELEEVGDAAGLLERLVEGVAPARCRPIRRGTNEAVRSQNRRVELTIID